jgi:hypothetical protein
MFITSNSMNESLHSYCLSKLRLKNMNSPSNSNVVSGTLKIWSNNSFFNKNRNDSRRESLSVVRSIENGHFKIVRIHVQKEFVETL